ncbi:hypothetical protein C3432_04020 [Citrobacter amalonaticus]|uniref:Uncharacterized protein n=1 Tax=Citrobacter amalonaticus TaxID=35703 RepID=A0A2S4S3K9_CITAM|nr:hypothetical protein [Citrobacter amalonaticus]POT59882.1 hypothetical protein C3432_04020 [Citrobacter amalonaticus]POT78013.1 hypothetical protein C3436_11690 [Citrobacter amalonaticus]POU68465.1 hypothetical protein C3430_05225 [Citrobacter amalonaticus]POV08068.1 hypothetical protein C3424_05235 [Citrobacter amalonaticus]
MKIIVFISLVTIEMLFLPDAFIYMFVKYFIPISDDGEYAMDSFELTVLLVKALMCAVGAGVAITLFRTH